MSADRLSTRWTLRTLDDEALVPQLANLLNDLPEALARALALRGVRCLDTARSFFRGDLKETHNPFLLRDMDRAAERMANAIRSGERVLVYGDYDVDGTTAAAMMVHFLRAHGAEASFFIPNRFEHGYGLCEEGLSEAVRREAALVIALDCGITAVEEAHFAAEQGLDLIIADHHEPGAELPQAVAVLNPKRADCEYPFLGLSGAGVGFKLIQGTLDRLGRSSDEALAYLDLLAVSIAADIVPVLDENRVLMREGLKRLQSEPRIGLRALAEVAEIDLAQADCARIVFGLGPRINAAGRLGSADRAVELLLAEDAEEAYRLARELEEVNIARRELDSRTTAQAMAQAALFIQDAPAALVLYHADWHPGVLGIVASRISEYYHRPAILLAGHDIARGSARSIHGVSIYQALAACSPLLERFGGHEAAAGLALASDNIEAFRLALNEAIGEITEPEDLEPEIHIDATLDLSLLGSGPGDRFWAVLQQFGPFGPDNPRPLFWARDLELVGQPKCVGRENKHLKLSVRQRDSNDRFDVIGFGLGDRLGLVQSSTAAGRPIELACCLSENRWNGRVSLQLEAKDVRIGEAVATA